MPYFGRVGGPDAAFSGVAAQLLSSAASLVASHADLSGQDSMLEDVRHTLSHAACDVHLASAASFVSRGVWFFCCESLTQCAYLQRLPGACMHVSSVMIYRYLFYIFLSSSQDADEELTSNPGCLVRIVSVSAADVKFVAEAAVTLGSRSPAPIIVITSEPVQAGKAAAAAAPQLFAAGAGGLPGSPRRAQATATAATPTAIAVPQITMMPEITTGLLVALLLIFFTSVGLTCVMSVKTPDVMHDTQLLAGKEY